MAIEETAKKTPAELAAEERKNIEVITSKATTDEDDKEIKVVEEKEEEIIEGEEKEEETKEEELTAEQLAAKEAEDKKTKTQERIQKRIDKEVAEKKRLAEENAELKRKLEAKAVEGETTLTEEDVNTRAETLAAQRIAERDFINSCNRLAEAAEKKDKLFPKKMEAMAEEIGKLPGHMIGILDDLDNGGDVLAHLTDNVEEAEKIYSMSPAKMAVELTKLSVKIVPKKEQKQISKVPDPINAVQGSAKANGAPKDTDNMDDWIAKRNKQVQERNAVKRAGFR